MADTPTASNRFRQIEPGTRTNTWGATQNDSFGSVLIDTALDGFKTIPITGNYTLTTVNFAADDARNRFLKFTGTLAADATITLPAVSKGYAIINATNKTLTFTTTSGATKTLIANEARWIWTSGTDVYKDTSNSELDSAAAAAALADAQAAAAAAAASAASVNDTNLVHKTGAETIAGVKTFSAGVSINSQTLDGLTAAGVAMAEATDVAAQKALLGMTLLETWNSTSGTEHTFTTFPTGTQRYLLVYEGVTISSSGNLNLYHGQGVSFNSGVTIQIGPTNAGGSVAAQFAGRYGVLSLATSVGGNSATTSPTASPIDKCKVTATAGAFTAGTFYLYV